MWKNKKFLLLFLTIILSIPNIYCEKKKNGKEEPIEVTLRLQWKIQAQFAGYYIALDKGFYKDAGLKVNIKEGGYGKDAISTVSLGVEEFGTKWMADLIGEEIDFISLANIVKKNGLVLISKKEKNINEPKDFIGKKVSIWFIGNEYQLYALLQKRGIPKEEVNIIAQNFDMSQFYSDDVDVASAMIYNELQEVYESGYLPKDINIIDFADYSLAFPGQCIFTSRKFYEKNSEICEKFTKASIKGWEYAVQHPEESVQILLKYDTKKELEAEFQLKQLKKMNELIEAEKHPIGIHLEKDIEKVVQIFLENDVIKEAPLIDKIYTNTFVTKKN